MRNLLMATAAIALVAGAAHADDQAKKEFGTTAGAASGAVAGAVVGGPVGAVVGGIAGAVIGNATAVPEDVRTYVVQHPVESVSVQGDLSDGYVLADDVRIHEIPSEPDYGYVYIQNRPVVVKTSTRKVVYAPAAETTASVSAEVPDTTITYVRKHPVDRVHIEKHVTVGSVLPDTVQLTEVPDNPEYAYVYTDNGPVVVDRGSRKVIWVH